MNFVWVMGASGIALCCIFIIAMVDLQVRGQARKSGELAAHVEAFVPFLGIALLSALRLPCAWIDTILVYRIPLAAVLAIATLIGMVAILRKSRGVLGTTGVGMVLTCVSALVLLWVLPAECSIDRSGLSSVPKTPLHGFAGEAGRAIMASSMAWFALIDVTIGRLEGAAVPGREADLLVYTGLLGSTVSLLDILPIMIFVIVFVLMTLAFNRWAAAARWRSWLRAPLVLIAGLGPMPPLVGTLAAHVAAFNWPDLVVTFWAVGLALGFAITLILAVAPLRLKEDAAPVPATVS